MKTIILPPWVAPVVIIVLLGGIVFGTYLSNRWVTNSGCVRTVDSEYYSADGISKLLATTEYCESDAIYARKIFMPPGQSMLGPAAREIIHLTYKDAEKAARRAPPFGINWESEGRLIVYHEEDVQARYETGDDPVMLVEFVPQGIDWEFSDRSQSSVDYSGIMSFTDGDSFEQLAKGLQKLKPADTVSTVYYDPKISKVINQSLEGMHRVVETLIDSKSEDVYVIDFTEGMSMDPGFVIRKRTTEGLKRVGGFAGEQLFIPGTGVVYIINSYNVTFPTRDKLVLKEGKLKYVKQPYKYVGLDSEATAVVRLYASQSLEEEVAILPRGSKVSVMLADGEFYLVRTPFGLVGWTHIKRGYNSPIAGLYFHGD